MAVEIVKTVLVIWCCSFPSAAGCCRVSLFVRQEIEICAAPAPPRGEEAITCGAALVGWLWMGGILYVIMCVSLLCVYGKLRMPIFFRGVVRCFFLRSVAA